MVEDALRSTPEDASPTLMITDVLGDLVLEVEVADTCKARGRKRKAGDQHRRTIFSEAVNAGQQIKQLMEEYIEEQAGEPIEEQAKKSMEELVGA